MGALLRGIYSIPGGASFLDDLAAGLVAAYPPEILAQTRVYLPTRRACRDLTEAFLRHTEGAGLLPTAFALGDVEADELAFQAIEPALSQIEVALDLPPAVSSHARTLMLARLSAAKHRAEHDKDLPLAAAIRQAEALGLFLDELAIERVDPDKIFAINTGQYAAHWQSVIAFLEIVLKTWPQVLEAEDRMDPAARREQLFNSQAAAWLATPPTAPVIIAGSTGTIASTRALMQAVLSMPEGAVVLPGFDLTLTEEDLKPIAGAPSHPQHTLVSTLKNLQTPIEAVSAWPASDFKVRAPRRRFIREALRPAETVGAWGSLERNVFETAKIGLRRVDAPNEDMEARVIALFLRDAANDQAHVALATPDRTLARRVVAELRRWGIEADDSGGVPFGETAIGGYLRLVAQAFQQNATATDILALLKHPLAAGGMDRSVFRRNARALELQVWRNADVQRRATSLAAVAGLLKSDDPLKAHVESLMHFGGPLMRLGNGASHSLLSVMRAHIEVAEALAATDAQTGTDRLWRGLNGESAASLLGDLLDAASASPELLLSNYADAFTALVSSAVIRPKRSSGGQIAILGVLEARLGRYGAIALGGLDEGVWPRAAAADPWFSRAMRREIGLSDPERRIGLSAHDFAQLIASPNVLLTRSLLRGGAPTKPSRWLSRLDAALAATGDAPLKSDGEPTLLNWALRLDPDLPAVEFREPEPRPPVSARPRSLFVTAIKTLRDDPYAVYARYILRLRALQPLDPAPSPADRGRIVHAAFEAFFREFPETLPDDIAAALMTAGAEAFRDFTDDPAITAFWLPAFNRAALWAGTQERHRRSSLGVQRVFAEIKGTAAFDAPAGPFLLSAKADRVDLLEDGSLAIVDIKTGAEPAKAALKDAREPQMPLEAAIALHGGFGDLRGRQTVELAIWRLGGKGNGKLINIAGNDVANAAKTAWDSAQRLIAAYDNETTPYLSEPCTKARFSDYRGLARRLEDVEEEE